MPSKAHPKKRGEQRPQATEHAALKTTTLQAASEMALEGHDFSRADGLTKMNHSLQARKAIYRSTSVITARLQPGHQPLLKNDLGFSP
jgi:hypothetical protein